MTTIRFILLNIFSVLFCFEVISAAEYFPAIEPHCSGMLQVDNLHSIYWEESGNPDGIPVIFLHGGPGCGTDKSHRTFFDPENYRIILFDQRGCGKSLPHGCLLQNTTWDLVEDINQLRQFLHIDRCVLFGGSWGSTLGLAYAIRYPKNVLGLILRGIFLSQQQELDWFYKDGANHLAPIAWQIFLSQIQKEEQDDLIKAYHDSLQSDSTWKRYNAAASWVLWEFAHMSSKPDPRLTALLNSNIMFYAFMALYAKQNHAMASIENHYFFNKCFFETDQWILENVHRIAQIPGFIIQGENDQICHWENALKLHQAWPSSTFMLIPEAGHAANEPGTLDALINATESFKNLNLTTPTTFFFP